MGDFAASQVVKNEDLDDDIICLSDTPERNFASFGNMNMNMQDSVELMDGHVIHLGWDNDIEDRIENGRRARQPTVSETASAVEENRSLCRSPNLRRLSHKLGSAKLHDDEEFAIPTLRNCPKLRSDAVHDFGTADGEIKHRNSNHGRSCGRVDVQLSSRGTNTPPRHINAKIRVEDSDKQKQSEKRSREDVHSKSKSFHHTQTHHNLTEDKRGSYSASNKFLTRSKPCLDRIDVGRKRKATLVQDHLVSVLSTPVKHNRGPKALIVKTRGLTNGVQKHVLPAPRLSYFRNDVSSETLALQSLGTFYASDQDEPLGAAFDHRASLYILTCTRQGKIVFLGEWGKVKDAFVSHLSYPSAVAVVEPGIAFAFVDNNRIYRCDYETERIVCIAESRSGTFRSLCAVSRDEILTVLITRTRDGPQITLQVYGARKYDSNVLYAELDYPCETRSDMSRARPSFCCSVGPGIVLITDLGLNRIFTVHYSLSRRELSTTGLLNTSFHSDLMNGNHAVRMDRVSGIAVDDDGTLLVADALQRRVYLMSSVGKILQEVNLIDDGGDKLPYAAQIALGRHTLLTCNRRTGGFSLYKLTTVKKKDGVVKSEPGEPVPEEILID